ncbi:MAG TPA: tetratricopeptide repeat protein, partial [Pyrinomonadaceae bacterium]
KIAPRIGEHAGAIAKLCGYLPLALRLAASALVERPDLNVADYVRRLTDAQQRLKLIDASLSLSYELLTPELQKRWRLLAVFPDTFDTAAAAAVWNAEPDTAKDALGEMFKYSLLEWSEATARYRLHDLARLFANARLSEVERNEGQRQHASFYLNVLWEANELYLRGGEAIKRGLVLFDLEWANTQAGQAWAEKHADEDDNVAAKFCSDYLDAGVYLLDLRQHPRERIRWLEVALTAARKLKDRAAEGMHLGNLGLVYAELGEVRRAIEFYEQRLAIAREIGDRRGEGTATGNLGSVYADLGETRRAIEFYEQQLTIVREIGDRRTEGVTLGDLGSVYAELGEVRRAIEFYERALSIMREIGDRRNESNALYNMSLSLDVLGERVEAIAHAEAALNIYEQIESPIAARVRETLIKWRG